MPRPSLGHDTPNGISPSINVRMSPELRFDLGEVAEAEEVTAGEFVRRSIASEIERVRKARKAGLKQAAS